LNYKIHFRKDACPLPFVPIRGLETAKQTGDRRRVTIPLSESEKALDAAWRALPLLPG
jgi:hypothetical protein